MPRVPARRRSRAAWRALRAAARVCAVPCAQTRSRSRSRRLAQSRGKRGPLRVPATTPTAQWRGACRARGSTGSQSAGRRRTARRPRAPSRETARRRRAPPPPAAARRRRPPPPAATARARPRFAQPERAVDLEARAEPEPELGELALRADGERAEVDVLAEQPRRSAPQPEPREEGLELRVAARRVVRCASSGLARARSAAAVGGAKRAPARWRRRARTTARRGGARAPVRRRAHGSRPPPRPPRPPRCGPVRDATPLLVPETASALSKPGGARTLTYCSVWARAAAAPIDRCGRGRRATVSSSLGLPSSASRRIRRRPSRARSSRRRSAHALSTRSAASSAAPSASSRAGSRGGPRSARRARRRRARAGSSALAAVLLGRAFAARGGGVAAHRRVDRYVPRRHRAVEVVAARARLRVRRPSRARVRRCARHLLLAPSLRAERAEPIALARRALGLGRERLEVCCTRAWRERFERERAATNVDRDCRRRRGRRDASVARYRSVASVSTARRRGTARATGAPLRGARSRTLQAPRRAPLACASSQRERAVHGGSAGSRCLSGIVCFERQQQRREVDRRGEGLDVSE